VPSRQTAMESYTALPVESQPAETYAKTAHRAA
jgi:hypothetical protein